MSWRLKYGTQRAPSLFFSKNHHFLAFFPFFSIFLLFHHNTVFLKNSGTKIYAVMNPEKPFLKPKTNKLYLVKQSSENIFYHLDFSEDLHKSMVLILKKREKRRVTSKQRVGEEEGENWC